MTKSPLKTYGFNYGHNGKKFSFYIVAESERDACDIATEMGKAKFAGELHEIHNV